MKTEKRNNGSRPSVFRLTSMALILLGIMLVFAGRLFSLQIANNKYYAALATPKNIKKVTIETTRGEICDRNGKKLISNQISYDIRLNRVLLPQGKENEIILSALLVFQKYNVTIPDSLPVSENPPYIYTKSLQDDQKVEKKLQKFIKNNKITDDYTVGTALYDYICNKYKITKLLEGTEYDESLVRKLAGLRYELELADFSPQSPYVLVKNADIGLVSAVSEIFYSIPGVETVVANSRVYKEGSLAAHILGRVGPIYQEEAKQYTEKGYSLDALVGKDGAEEAFEDYLRGINGIKEVEFSADNREILSENTVLKPKPGYSVYLTIDAEMQRVAESALENAVKAAEKLPEAKKTDIHSGAIVVENPNNGEILAIASYPTFDQQTYQENIAQMLKDPLRPLYNRATLGLYPPGSTFKIATAAAALTKGIITPQTTINDKGIYKAFDTYQPHCWVYDKYGYTHGNVNVTKAIQESCNYFFFEVGRLLGIESLNEYARTLGLGVKTGIEIGESQGILAGPEYRNDIGKIWNPGDVIQAAIGQSDNAFTPIQICSFMSTIVNGGTRYRSHLLKSVKEFGSAESIQETGYEVLGKADLSYENCLLLKNAMRQVVEEGTASSAFSKYPHEVGGKTGTAQTGTGSDNAVFAGFAPFDAPEIVVTVIIENGYKSSVAANAAKEIFDYYYRDTDEKEPNQPDARNLP